MSFLSAAEATLSSIQKPLTDKELVERGLNLNHLVTEGNTPQATMRARLSEEIRVNGFQSRFQRVGPNRFALREWKLPEYFAPPFLKSIPDEEVVAVDDAVTSPFLPMFGFDTQNLAAVLEFISEPSNLRFLPRPQAETTEEFRQLISYVMLSTTDGSILTYRRGKFSAAHEMLRGARCLGFGGHVQVRDANDLFGRSSGGLYLAAEREIFEELDGVLVNAPTPLGIINDRSSPEGVKHLGIVLRAELPPDFDVSRKSGERAVNDLRLVSQDDLAANYHEFEFWSQLLIRNLCPKYWRYYHGAIVRPGKRVYNTDTIVVVGEIACGKTTFVRALQERFHFVPISTRACVSSIIGVPDFGVEQRDVFQREAARLVAESGGVQRLVDEITKQANSVSGPRVIDGIRNVATLKRLRLAFPNLIVIYIDAARDFAYENYCRRSKRSVSIDEFRRSRYHPVEHEVAELRQEADVYIFNGGTPEELINAFETWWTR